MSVDTHDLPRGFGLATPVWTIIASMIGVGILTTSGFILRDTGNGAVLMVLWVVGGIIAICGSLTIVELATALPFAGGEYVYIREAYGRPWAFLSGWVSFVIGFSAPTAIIAYGAGLYLVEALSPESEPVKAALTRTLAMGFVLAFTAMHVLGQSFSARVQGYSTVIKLAVVLAIIVGGFCVAPRLPTHVSEPSTSGPVHWSVLAISLIYIMYSCNGWNAATYLAGELKQPVRVLPRATLIGCGTVVILYILLNAVYLLALHPRDLAGMTDKQVEPIAALATQRLFGPWVARPFSAAIGVGLLASVSAYILTGPRIYFAMARDGLFPAFAGRLHARTGAPVLATLLQSALTLVLLASSSLRNILTYAGVGLSASSFFVVLSVFVLRIRQPDLPRPFRTPGYPLTPLVFLICTAWMIVFAFQTQPGWSALSLATILGGLPIYWVWQRLARPRPGAV